MSQRRILIAVVALTIAAVSLLGSGRPAVAASNPDTGGPYNGVVGELIAFSAVNSTGAVSWRWDFGDGTYGSGMRVNKAYGFPGFYYVVLTTTDETGTASSALTTVSVHSNGTITTLLPFGCTYIIVNGVLTCALSPVVVP